LINSPPTPHTQGSHHSIKDILLFMISLKMKTHSSMELIGLAVETAKLLSKQIIYNKILNYNGGFWFYKIN